MNNDLITLQDYYSNLLILQYITKNKAVSTIQALIKILLPINSNTGNSLINDTRDAFNINTAFGNQLDVIGYTVGVNRLYYGFAGGNYFVFYDEISNNYIDYPNLGYSDESNISINGGEWLDDNNFLSFTNTLNDNDFRTIIYLKIFKNTTNNSWSSINNIINTIFGSSIYIGTCGNMSMTYFVPSSTPAIFKAAALKGLLPKPLGVSLNYIPILTNEAYFGFFDNELINHIGYNLLSDVPDIGSLTSISSLLSNNWNWTITPPILGYNDESNNNIIGGICFDENNFININD